jgi:F-type H+-transporting ATPase subunit delta
MNNNAVAKEYAKALFLLASRTERIDRIAQDFADFAGLVKKSGELRRFLEVPQLSAETKKELLERNLRGRVDEYFLKFLLVLIDKRRQDQLLEIQAAYETELDRFYNRIEVAAESAVELTESERGSLIARLTGHLGRTVVLKLKVDPRLLGGLVCRIGDMIYDGSIRRRIDRLCHQMLTAK